MKRDSDLPADVNTSGAGLAGRVGPCRRPAKRWLVGGLIFLVAVLLLELLLKPLRLRQYDRLFLPRSNYPIFIAGEADNSGFFVTNRHFWQAFNFQRFALRKPAGVRRVFVLGGSAAYGWPGDDRDSFTGYLRRALDNIAPGSFEIVNAAGFSYGSHRVLDTLTEVLDHSPDLVVIYSGNNEFIERNILPAMELSGGWALGLRNILSRLDLYRAGRLIISRTPYLKNALISRRRDITDLRYKPAVDRGQITATPDNATKVLQQYNRNLSRMAELLRQARVRGVACSVPVNLRSWKPEAPPLDFPDEAAWKRWRSTYHAGIEFLETDPRRAAELMRQALTIKPNWPTADYYLGKAGEALGDYQGAEAAYKSARDHDARPLRALGPGNEIVRSVASAYNLDFLDLEGLFAANSPNGLTGPELMLDYCHPTTAGHKLIAAALLPLILKSTGAEDLLPELKQLIIADPGPQEKNPLRKAEELYAIGMSASFNGDYEKAERYYLEALALAPDHAPTLSNLGVIRHRQGRLEEALSLYRGSLAVSPYLVDTHFNYALLAIDYNDLATAEEHLQKVLDMTQDYPAAWVLRADIALKRNDPRGALELYEQALSRGEDNYQLRIGRAKALMAQGRRQEAALDLERALAFDPRSDAARRLLETVSAGGDASP